MTFLRRKKWLAACLLGLAVGMTFLLGRAQFVSSAENEAAYRRLKLLAEVLETIQSKYVEPPDVEKLINGAIKGMVASLDPHSAYLPPEEFKELEVETSGRFTGIGIEITLRDGWLTVVSPIEGTPADQAGVKAGDRIIKVDGKLTKQMSLTDAVKTIRGPKGSKVVLTILRSGEKEMRDFAITREVIPLVSVRQRTLEPGYGYVRISTFQGQTTRDVVKALGELESQAGGKLKGLVLDLRNNPGGLLNQAVEVADLFLESGLIVYTQGRGNAQNMKFYAHPDDKPRRYAMVCLVNQGSASASEIVAGALKDHKRAVIMGMPTFGKGSVQTIIPFDDKSGLRLTTARYFTPNGVSIQAKGITPDVTVELAPPPSAEQEKKEQMRLSERDLLGHIEGDDEKAKRDVEEKAPEKSEAAKLLAADSQLREALGMLKAWEVFSKTR